MNKRWYSNLVLLIAVIAIAAIIYIQPGVEQAQFLPTVTAESLTTLRIQRADRPSITLKKEGPIWRVTEPFSTHANPSIVNVLSQLTNMPAHKTFVASEDHKKSFELEHPRTCVTLNKDTLCFGTQHATHTWRYVLMNDRIYLINDRHYALLNSPATYYADPHPLEEHVEVAGVFKGNQGFSKSAHGNWLQENVVSPVSDKALDQIANNWTRIKADNVVIYEGDPLPVALSVLPENTSEPYEFALLERGSGFSLVRNGLEYQLKHDHWPLLWPYK